MATDFNEERKEFARRLRRAQYLLAKERRKNDPRQIELKALMKERRRQAFEANKERRKLAADERHARDRAKADQQLMQLVHPARDP